MRRIGIQRVEGDKSKSGNDQKAPYTCAKLLGNKHKSNSARLRALPEVAQGDDFQEAGQAGYKQERCWLGDPEARAQSSPMEGKQSNA